MSINQLENRYQVVYASGVHEMSIAFRVDDKERAGCKMIICAKCITDLADTVDARTIGGSYLCEHCHGHYGSAEAHKRLHEIYP